MVLQQKVKAPVWGWATPGELVRVDFAGQSLTSIAGADSMWQVKLRPLSASETPQSMTITAGKQRLVLNNILVGEVWICSGQSNMEYPMDKSEYNMAGPVKGIDSAALEMQSAHPGIRVIKVEKKIDGADATTTGWQECQGKSFARSSAVGYYFAKRIHKMLQTPVGIITSAWSGSYIEPWTPSSAYAVLPAFRGDLNKSDTIIGDARIGTMYRGMIKPLAPFAIKGFIWYQGEENCMIEEHDMRYAYKMQALVEGWRKLWGNQLPFYYVLIAPFKYTEWKNNIPHTTETLPLFWEQQVAASQIPNTGFISVTDLVDNLEDIHPSYKWVVGRRLANLALAKTYRYKGVSYLQPQYAYKKRRGNQLVITFKNARGLKTADGRGPDYFEIAAKDGHFLSADAVIKGRKVILTNPTISQPVDARFGWTEVARPNLINAADLPAVPFRTNGEKWNYKHSK